jgi:hypothetical protein
VQIKIYYEIEISRPFLVKEITKLLNNIRGKNASRKFLEKRDWKYFCGFFREEKIVRDFYRKILNLNFVHFFKHKKILKNKI